MFKKSIIIALLSVSLYGSEEDINPLPFDYVNFQFAGQIGLLSVGGGNTFFDDHYDFEVYLGLTPRIEQVSEVTIITLAMKNNFIPYTFKYQDFEARPYIGLGLFFAMNQRYDPNWQDDIDSSYYYQNNWHVTGHIGLNVNKKVTDLKMKSIGVYVESMTNDVYFLDYIQNQETLSIDDVFSIAFGVRIGF